MNRHLSLMTLLFAGCIVHAQPASGPKLTVEEQAQAEKAKKLETDGIERFNKGQRAEAVALMQQALDIRRQVFTPLRFPDGHADLADGFNNLGFVQEALGDYRSALPNFEKALAVYRQVFPESKHPDGHADTSACLHNIGSVLTAMGDFEKALGFHEQALAMDRKLYPVAKFPAGHDALAESIAGLGGHLKAMGQYERARPYYDEALAMQRKLYPASKFPDGHPSVARAIMNLGHLLQAAGTPTQALPAFEEALAMRRRIFPEARFPAGHPDLAGSLGSMADILMILGKTDEAVPFADQAFTMLEKIYSPVRFPNGHPELARALGRSAALNKRLGAIEQGLRDLDRSVAMLKKLYPASRYPNSHPELFRALSNRALLQLEAALFDEALVSHREALQAGQLLYPEARFPAGHPDLATCLHNLGALYAQLGQHNEALTFHERSLAMRRRLFPESRYPNGHAELAYSLGNIATLLSTLGLHDKAIAYAQDALSMWRKLYPADRFPNGQRDIGISLTRLGVVHMAARRLAEGLAHHEEALEMSRKLYPDGRDLGLAAATNNVAEALRANGHSARALDLAHQALRLYRRLYPRETHPAGHQNLLAAVHNVGAHLLVAGEREQALEFLSEAWTMHRGLTDRVISTSSEAEALAYVHAQPAVRDLLLSATVPDRKQDSAAYDAVWHSKAVITRVLEGRQARARLAGKDQAVPFERLAAIRRRTEYVLNDAQMEAGEKDRLLARLNAERADLERRLAADLPGAKKALGSIPPDRLKTVLPDGLVLIDCLKYVRLETDPQRMGEERIHRVWSYAAFVCLRDKPPVRVELGPAAPIDRAIRDWRSAIEGRQDTSADMQIRRLIWEPIARHLPASVRTLSISPDGDLSRLPWCAIPGARAGSVLLEEFAGGIGQTPHGPALIESLQRSPLPASAGTSLVLAEADYGVGPWQALPATAREIKAIAEVSTGPIVSMTRADANAQRLRAELPRARVAHLATHGFFEADTLAGERRRERARFEQWAEGRSLPPVAARNPLGFTGLVLAKGEIITGLSLIDLPLDGLHLAVLSACETGLGEFTDGEGVFGLVRAFHLAGCPNVVASLWKVNDVATAALMAKFYHEMWVNKKPPIEALREAQLTIYRNPGQIPDLAGERGSVRVKEAVAAPVEPASRRERADTKLWAAFVLSGLGR